MDPFDPPVALPLFPVEELVHFPQAELAVELAAPAHRELVRHLLAQSPEDRLLGVVLLKPNGRRSARPPKVFGAGTCARVVRVEALAGDRVRLHLRGSCRFTIEEEVPRAPFRQALVRLVDEPAFDEGEPEIRDLRRRLGERLMQAHASLGEGSLMSREEIGAALQAPFEELVNRIAQQLDVPPLRKLELLACPLPERALEVLGILRSRIKLVQLLTPFRHLACAVETN